MKKTVNHLSVADHVRMFRQGKIDFDLNVQRNLLWDIKRKSLFIDSLIHDYPVPMFFVVRDEEKLHFLDGQQRTNAMVEFMSDNFKLHKCITDERCVDMKFSELPQRARVAIEKYEIQVCEIIADKTEIEEVFIRLNNGVPLIPFELTRSKAGKEVIDFVEDLVENEFFKKLPLSDKQRKRYGDQEIAIQAMGLIDGGLQDFNAWPMRDYVQELRQYGIPKKLHEKMIQVVRYLNRTPFDYTHPAIQRALMKSNASILVSVVDVEMEPEAFAEKVKSFFQNPTPEFQETQFFKTTNRKTILTKRDELKKAL